VLGRIDLTAVEGGRSLLQIARLSPDGILDIEAIAYRDGALFIGLKSPLTAEGRAVVMRLADPVKATRDGRVEEKALSTWAELPLCLRVKGKRVCQGLSDMLFLDDGSLVVSANAPKGGKKDHGGAIWLAPPPIGKAPPRLLRTFPGLKPEGVAFSPQRHTLLVVFDRGQEKKPLWTEIPVPADSASEAGSTPGARP
jgi:hypothetical protein